jgi:excisionase family DNA binding protein
MTVQEAARYLRASSWMVRRMISEEGLPHLKLGKRIVIARADLDAYFERQKVANPVWEAKM